MLTMRPRPVRTFIIIAIDLLIALMGAMNLPSVVIRPAMPFVADMAGGRVVVAALRESLTPNQISPGDVLVSWDDIPISASAQLEVIADRLQIGYTGVVTIKRGGINLVVPVSLVPYYGSMRFPVIMGIVGLFVLLFSIVLMLKRPDDPAAIALHWTLVSVGALILSTQGAVEPGSSISVLRRACLFLFYNTSAAGFFMFTTLFPVRRFGEPRIRISVVTIAAVSFTAGLAIRFAHALSDPSAPAVEGFQFLYEIFHIWFLLLLASGFVLLGIGYLAERRPDQRAALRWIVWGVLIGCIPFIIAVVLPQSVGAADLIPEEVSVLFTLAIPLCFTIAFLRYHVFRIEVERYHRLTTWLVALLSTAVQAAVALTAVSLVSEHDVFHEGIGVAVGLVAAVLLLNPARRRLQRLMEESLFPARFSGTSILRRASALFHSALSVADLGQHLVHELHTSVPATEAYWYSLIDGAYETSVASTGQTPLRVGIPEAFLALLQKHRLLVRRGAGHTLTPTDDATQQWLTAHGFDLAIGLASDTGEVLGVACCRMQHTREPLSREECEVILGISAEAKDAVERLHLQEAVILEQQERRKTEQLSQLKSHFVSGVSHDVRSPLASIRMFAEILQNPKVPAKRRQEYLRIIERESARLSRLVSNVLDFARVEKGVKEYRLTPSEPANIIRSAVEAMAMQIRGDKAVVRVKLPRRLPAILADADALEDAIVNLISNALKYSPKTKQVSISARVDGDDLLIIIADNGVGIPPELQAKVFEPFFRVRDERTSQVGGVGLGLQLVKHTVEGHGGTVTIASRPGAGTTITLRLPVMHSPVTGARRS